MTNELIEKAKACKSVEELFALAKENGMEMTAEQAAEQFAQLHNEGELSDEELNGAAGGGCHRKDGRLVVTTMYRCDFWVHEKCGKNEDACQCIGGYDHGGYRKVGHFCNTCKYCSYEKGLWLCNNEANRQ